MKAKRLLLFFLSVLLFYLGVDACPDFKELALIQLLLGAFFLWEATFNQ